MRSNSSFSIFPNGWNALLNKLSIAIYHPNAHSRNALASLFINMTRIDYDETLWLDIMGGIVNESSIFVPVDVPEIVTTFLTCSRSQEAFNLFNHSAEYSIPPIVLSSSSVQFGDFRGWVAFNNCVVINHSIYRRAFDMVDLENYSGIMDLCTLLGHESKHGDIRKAHGRFSFHGEEEVLQAGKKWEKAFWCGLWPRWCEPISKVGTKELAREIYDQLVTNGQITFTQAMIEKLISQVGTRDSDESYFLPGIDFHKRRTFIE